MSADDRYITTTRASGAPEIQITSRGLARMLCLTNHGLAEWLGTIAPLQRCCAECARYPAGHATTWTWPA